MYQKAVIHLFMYYEHAKCRKEWNSEDKEINGEEKSTYMKYICVHFLRKKVNMMIV